MRYLLLLAVSIRLTMGGEAIEQEFFSAIETRDFNKARTIAAKGCDEGNLFGCTMLGSFYESGLGGVKVDPKKALELHRKACTGGQMRGCSNLGTMYAESKAIPHDFEKAVKYFTMACDQNEPGGCFGLGVLYAKGTGVKKDPFRAFKLFQKACYYGMPLGCRVVEQMSKGSGKNGVSGNQKP